MHNELEPGCERSRVELGHENLELFRRNPLCVANLVDVRFERDVGSDEEDVVDLVLTPDFVLVTVGCKVVDAGEVLELVERDLFGGDAELVVELALCCTTNTDLLCFLEFTFNGKGVRAAGVGPHVGKGDLLWCSSLQQELAGCGVEEEDGESTMQETLVDVGHEMAFFLASIADILVVVVENHASFLHETNLLFVVASK